MKWRFEHEQKMLNGAKREEAVTIDSTLKAMDMLAKIEILEQALCVVYS